MSNTLKRILLLAVSLPYVLAATSIHAQTAPRVAGEPSRATLQKTQIEQSFRGDVSNAPSMTFFAVDPAKIESIKLGNALKYRKATQIGVTQFVANESFDTKGVQLKWQAVDGGNVASLKVRSPGALGIRAAIHTSEFPAGAEIRFAGSDTPLDVVYAATSNEVITLLDAEKRYWTPMTEGDTQILEIFVPAGVSLSAMKFDIDAVSHIFASAKDGFKAAVQTKAGICEVDTICPTPTTGYVNAKNAVAHMQFSDTSGTFVCTGTLLNDNDTTTQIPYFYGANHCISAQAVANTLTTYWGYENPTCGGANISRSQSTAVFGGAQLLYADQSSDVLLLQLNRAPPASAFFLGWDANTIAVNTPITVIHHPLGDPKKVSLGQVIDFKIDSGLGGSFISPGYTSGTTEGGSSGSGLLTIAGGNYFLRGGLLGGPASCSNSGSLVNANTTGNYDEYSRFDQAFPNIRKWLFDSTGVTPLAPLSKRGGIDIDGTNNSVLVVRSTSGVMQGGRLVNNVFQWSAMTDPGTNYRLLGAVDFAGNGKSDMAYLNTVSLNANGQGASGFWRDFNSAVNQSLNLVKPAWDVQAVGDLDGDGFGDLVWRFRGQSANIDDQGVSYIWFTNGNGVTQVRKRGGAPLTWTLLGATDLNGDGAADMVYVSPANAMRVLMATPNRTCANLSGGSLPTGFNPIKLADFTGARKGDVLARNPTTGDIKIITLDATGLTLPPYTGTPDDPNASCTSSNLTVPQTSTISIGSTSTWTIYATGDFNGDGIFDIVFLRPDNQLVVWLMNANGAMPTVINAGPAPTGFSPFPLQ